MSSYIIRFSIFLFDQIMFVINHRILQTPIPGSEKENELRTIYYDMLFKGKAKSKDKPPKTPMTDVMIRQREYSVNELLATEKMYSLSLRSLGDYRDETEDIIKSDAYKLFFENLDNLIDNSFRVEILLTNENKKGGKAANYGKVFFDLTEDFKLFKKEIDKFTDAVDKFQTLFHEDKKFRRKIKSLERRLENKFISLLRAPLERLGFYQVKLEEIFGATPKWHDDYDKLNNFLEMIKQYNEEASKLLEEEERKTNLLKIQDKIRDCKLMDNPKRFYIGRWRLMESKMSCFVFSDILIITQQKTELFSRKKYHIIKKQIEISSIEDINIKDESIFIKTKSRKYELKIKIKSESLYNEILKQKEQKQ